MGYVVVFVLATGVGAAVYLVTTRGGIPFGRGAGAVATEGGPAAFGTPHTDWQTRVTGLVGLAIAVILAAVVLAAAVYAVGSAVGKAVGDAATNGSVKNG
jgi:hypothetical protein